ncbi:MAG: leucine-rich repeat protein [Clostridia bacterium]|nr:leucine-rich repeat protein [Clostridia bacterium]
MKKFLSMALACLTIFGSVSACAKSDAPKQKVSPGKICGVVVAGVAALAAGIVAPVVGAKLSNYFPAITVGTPEHNLTRNDLKKYSKKEEVEIHGFMAVVTGHAGQKILVDVVRAKTIKIRDGVTGIDAYAFGDCAGTQRIIIPKSVKSIAEDAFHSMHVFFKPKIVYNGKDYPDVSSFLKEFNKNNK